MRNPDCGLMIFKRIISCHSLLSKPSLTFENTKFIAGEISLIVSLYYIFPQGITKPYKGNIFYSNICNNSYKSSILALFLSVCCTQINLQLAFIAVLLSFSSSPIKISFVIGKENLSAIICKPL